ncbi:MAG: hypothetical protein Q9179_004796 [Wetmoreana sp. 5 TL-2023]
MSHTTLMYHTFLSVESIRLGRLVRNIDEPQSDYLDPDCDLRPDSVVITPQSRYEEVQQSATDQSFTAVLTRLLSASRAKRNKVHTQVTTDRVTTYQLGNSGSWFKSAIKTLTAREWIKESIDQGDDIYVVVGFHTMLDAQVAEGAAVALESSGQLGLPVTGAALAATGVMVPLSDIADPRVAANKIKEKGIQRRFVADGEQICAVQYRKVRFRWFSSRDLDAALLEKGNRWKIIVPVHGLRGHPLETWTSCHKADNGRAVGATSRRQYIRSIFNPSARLPRSDSMQNGTNTRQRQLFWPHDYLAKDIPQARVWTFGYNADVIGGLFQAGDKNSVSQHGRNLAVRLEREIDNEALCRSEAARQRTKFIVFLGTPHRGSELASWGEIASNLARLALQDSHKKIIETLEVNNEVLDNIHEQFVAVAFKQGIRIHSFQEARGMSGIRGLHRKKLKELEDKLIISSNCQKLVLVGLGGVGKTQVALKLAYTVKDCWPEYSIFWVPAVSGESFEQAYRDIASHCSIALNPTEEDPTKSVQRYLNSNSAGKWLLVVDNADDEEILFGAPDGSRGVIDYLPESENGLTLFTTRYRQIAVSLAGNELIEIQEMNHEEAGDFLKKSLTRKELLQDRVVTAELLKELAYLPLAIAQAAAYLNAMQISPQEYLSLLRNTEQDTISLLSREFRDETRYNNSKYSKNAVAATWLVSFNHICRSDTIAADLLAFMSCIEHKAISRSILPLVKPEERMVHAMGTLRAYAFVTRRGDSEVYDMHRLVHLATKVWLGERGATNELNGKVAAHLAEIFPSDDYANRPIWREYFPHAFQCLRNTSTLDIEVRYTLCMAVGRCLQVDGRIEEAVVWLSECFFWRQERFPEDHPSRLASQHVLTGAYEANGQVKEAVELLEQVVAIEKEVLKEDHPDRLASQHELARVYEANGQVKEAVELLEQVVAIRKEVLKEDHPSRLASQHELARVYEANGHVKRGSHHKASSDLIHNTW